MGLGDLVVYILVTILLSWGLARGVTRRPFAWIARPNYRGVKVNPLLGAVVAASGIWVVIWSLASRALGGRWESRFSAYVWLAIAGVLVLAAGFADDLADTGPRGLRGHLRSALEGRPTTGLLKIGAAIVSGFLVVEGMPARPVLVMAAGVVMIAGCANVWNDLDVAPGRAGKYFVLCAAVLPFVGATSAPQVLLFVLLFAEMPTLAFDLRERGMLGDSGANFLGFAVGAALYGALPEWGVATAAAIVLVMNLVAETITFSRVVAAVAPLRWFDLLGTSAEWRSFSANRRSG